MELPVDAPVYELAIEFYTTFLGLRHETGAKYLALGILVPDALTATAKRPYSKLIRCRLNDIRPPFELTGLGSVALQKT